MGTHKVRGQQSVQRYNMTDITGAKITGRYRVKQNASESKKKNESVRPQPPGGVILRVGGGEWNIKRGGKKRDEGRENKRKHVRPRVKPPRGEGGARRLP